MFLKPFRKEIKRLWKRYRLSKSASETEVLFIYNDRVFDVQRIELDGTLRIYLYHTGR